MGVLFLAGGGLTGCKVENDNDVSCIAKDCGTFCQALGFTEGSCTRDDQCECGPGSTDMYHWNDRPDAGSDTASDRETDTDRATSEDSASDTRTATEADTGTGESADTGGSDTAPDGGADSGPGTN